jgi:hypothetical protein
MGLISPPFALSLLFFGGEQKKGYHGINLATFRSFFDPDDFGPGLTKGNLKQFFLPNKCQYCVSKANT